MLIGNASSQISILRRKKILEEYNKDLLSFAQDRAGEFIKAAPMLFGAQFPKDVADHLEQVAALRRAKSSAGSSSQGFQKASSSQWSGQRSCSKAVFKAVHQAQDRIQQAEGDKDSQFLCQKI